MDDSPRCLCVCSECSNKQREIEALVRLVDQYQRELAGRSVCDACAMSASRPHQTVVEELFEFQRLNALHWAPAETCGHMGPQLIRPDGTLAQFNEVVLPSSAWLWTTDWNVDVNTKTDIDGWVYALTESDLAVGINCRSDRTIDDRVRRRRWIRERKKPIALQQSSPDVFGLLDSERRISDLQSANIKLTEQLRKASERILEYEDRIKIYEDTVKKLQPPRAKSPPLRIQSREKLPSSSALFSPSKSREVLSQTEALLSQILSATPVLDEATQEVQRRRSHMVQECQDELDSAVGEFQNLLQTFEDQS